MFKESVEMPVSLFVSDVVIPFLKNDDLIFYILIDKNFNFLKEYIGKLAVLNENEKNVIAKKTKQTVKKMLFN